MALLRLPAPLRHVAPFLTIGLLGSLWSCGSGPTSPSAVSSRGSNLPTTGAVGGAIRTDPKQRGLPATITITDGPNAGRTVTTQDGRFNLTGLRFGRVTLLVDAPPFREDRRWVYIDPQNPAEIIEYHFIQAGDGIDETFTGSLRASDAACASPFDPLHDGKPCHKYGPYQMPLTGGMNVQLVWRLPALNELDFEIWRNGVRWLSSGGPTAEGAADRMFGGVLEGSYEFRVVYLGRATQDYQLQVNVHAD